MIRREFSKAVQRAALARADGRCEGVLTDDSRCPCALQVGRFHYDHIVPAALTEDASLAGAVPALSRGQDGGGCGRDRAGAAGG